MFKKINAHPQPGKGKASETGDITPISSTTRSKSSSFMSKTTVSMQISETRLATNYETMNIYYMFAKVSLQDLLDNLKVLLYSRKSAATNAVCEC